MSVRTMGRVASALVALAFVMPAAILTAQSANALDQPQTPQPVAEYFATGLIPRLIDLYGSGDGTTKGIDFDATTRVGSISRVREWTPDYLAGQTTDDPTRLTNDWVAPVSVRGAVLGLATVWINPADDQPELANFDPADVAHEVLKAPVGSWLVHDPARKAWFAMTEDELIPLESGTSGVTGPISPAAYQKIILATAKDASTAQPGVTIAALVLGIVTLGVALFVLMPVRRNSGTGSSNPPFDGLEKPY